MPSSFREEDFQRFCYFFFFFFFILVAMATRVMIGIQSLNNFGRTLPKEHPCQVLSRLAQWFRRRRCLKKLWTTHDGQRTTDDARRTPDDARRTPDIGRSQKLTMSTLSPGELKSSIWPNKIYWFLFSVHCT